MEFEYDEIKQAILEHVAKIFEEIEEEMAMSHQEKYALLEDLLENASDPDELRVAFDQWYADHGDDLELEESVDELWEQAMARLED